MLRLRTPLVAAVALSAGLAQDAHAIVGGTDVPEGKRDYVAYISIDGLFACTGTLVSPTVVVTAGHCSSITGVGVATPIGQPGQLIEVTLGSIEPGDADGEKPPVDEVVVHPNYSFANPLVSDRETDVSNDVALLKLGEPSVQPPVPIAAVEERELWRPGRLAQIAGFGTTSSGGDTPDVMQETEVPIVEDSLSAEVYPGSFEPFTQIGAGFPEGGKDTCQGDSGGPLIVPTPDGALRLVGDTSYGSGCADPNTPGIYGRVADDALREWIRGEAPDAIAPAPAAEPEPDPEPTPTPDPVTTPEPTPFPSPSPEASATPTPTPTPAPTSPGTGSGGSGGTGGTGGGAGTPAAPLRLDAATDRRRLGRATRGGLRLRLRCTTACDAAATLSVSRATARRLGLKSRIVARVLREDLTGRRTVQLRFTPAARRALRRSSRVALTLRVVALDAGGTKRTVTRTTTLRR